MCHRRHVAHDARPRPHAAAPPRDVRISDAERDQAITRLGDHAAEGRLTADELDQRTDAALAARTHADLEPLFADLPGRPPARGQRPGRDRDGLREHLLAFTLVNVMLIGIWLGTGAGYFWPIWPLLGWGIGLLSHAGGARSAGFGRPDSHAQ